jgi:hypothetical protein
MRWFVCAVAVAGVSLGSVARADVAPGTGRPDWTDHPAPLPEPPAEDEEPKRALAILVATALASGAALRRRRVLAG